MVLSDFRKLQFSAPIFGHGATPAPGGLEHWKTPKKLTHQVVLPIQLLTRNRNFLNISGDTLPPPLNAHLCLCSGYQSSLFYNTLTILTSVCVVAVTWYPQDTTDHLTRNQVYCIMYIIRKIMATVIANFVCGYGTFAVIVYFPFSWSDHTIIRDISSSITITADAFRHLRLSYLRFWWGINCIKHRSNNLMLSPNIDIWLFY